VNEDEAVNWRLVYTKQAQKDAKKLVSSNLKDKTEELLAIIAENPFQNPPLMKSWLVIYRVLILVG
jgi:mRNA-degrading endonuclease RelE of RelBE toxin-antitoxin system